jgi:ABC-type phosphate transport system permease subunit
MAAAMKRIGRAAGHAAHLVLAAVLGTLSLSPAFAQDSSSTSTSHTSTTTSSSSEFISDWRLWALVGAVVLIILIIALTRRGGGGDTTTIVK